MMKVWSRIGSSYAIAAVTIGTCSVVPKDSRKGAHGSLVHSKVLRVEKRLRHAIASVSLPSGTRDTVRVRR